MNILAEFYTAGNERGKPRAGLKAMAQYRPFRREKGKGTAQTDWNYISS
jgi:hypothetical protein